MNEKKEEDLFEKLLNGEDITETVDLGKRGVFTIKYPLGSDRIEIARRKALFSQGLSEDFDFRFYAVLDTVVIDGPSAWKKSKAEKYPDETVLVELYRRFLRLTERVRTQIGGSKESEGEGEDKDKDPNVGDGLFQGVAIGPEPNG